MFEDIFQGSTHVLVLLFWGMLAITVIIGFLSTRITQKT
jgi:hypothetical protein